MSLAVDFLSQIADYLEQQGLGYATAQTDHAVDIFVGKQPGDPHNCITLIGEPGIITPDVSIPDLMFPRFQLLVRNENFNDGSAKLRDCRTALHDKIALSLQNFFCYYILADQEGFPIGEDAQGRSEFSIHFRCEIRYGDSIA
jgi:hypothetical protein